MITRNTRNLKGEMLRAIAVALAVVLLPWALAPGLGAGKAYGGEEGAAQDNRTLAASGEAEAEDVLNTAA
ncbi:MAG: hypothetical protein LBS91_02045, partial [Clostridiales Family XIII bacterium]|nr:hypothetical protein [Clostridiales Family XIII bacterium]